jgi:hypothetical protein
MFVLNGIVASAYGISFLLVPAIVLSIYGVTQGPAEKLMGQFFGVALVAIGLLTWLARGVTDASAQRAMILALLISNVTGVIVSVLGTLSGVMSAVGWSAVAIYVLFTLGYGYFQFTKPAPETPSSLAG